MSVCAATRASSSVRTTARFWKTFRLNTWILTQCCREHVPCVKDWQALESLEYCIIQTKCREEWKMRINHHHHPPSSRALRLRYACDGWRGDPLRGSPAKLGPHYGTARPLLVEGLCGHHVVFTGFWGLCWYSSVGRIHLAPASITSLAAIGVSTPHTALQRLELVRLRGLEREGRLGLR